MALSPENAPISTILFASDLSENSRRAFEYASALAARQGAQIVLLHVIQELPGNWIGMLDRLVGENTIERFRESRRREAREILMGKLKEARRVRRALERFYGAGAGQHLSDETEIVIREGVAGDEILGCAREFGCDLIVLGSSCGERSGVMDVGGITKDILRRSPIPVLISPPEVAGTFSLGCCEVPASIAV